MLFLLASLAGCTRHHSNQRLIVLGVDGMDPGFLERHWDVLPNLAAIKREGGFRRLGTTIPPQSPVAWSTFMTGLDPGGHGVFDFVHRDPATMKPFSSMAETEEPAHTLSLGPYLLPLSAGRVRLLREGTAFWQLLWDRGIPVTVIHIPNNFPPLEGKGKSLSGMGTPDMQGTFGTFTYFTDEPSETARDVSGGRIAQVEEKDGRVVIPIPGPQNTLRKDRAQTHADMTVDIDPTAPVARFRIGDSVFVLAEQEWSGWIRAEFPLIPVLKSATGIFRVYVKQYRPFLKMYVSPVNIDPAAPELPISTPECFGKELAAALGPFYTQGIAEDTAIYRAGLFDRQEFRSQSRLVAEEQFAMLKYALAHFEGGLLFYYFSSLDQGSHMLWGKHEDELLEVYRSVDRAIGWARAHSGGAPIMVMSDHGFTNFDRAVNLNTWLLREAFLELDDPSNTGPDEYFAHVDWSKTQAYAMGLNGLYVNLRGREKNGIVAAGAEKREVLKRISERLLALRDPKTGAVVVTAVYDPEKVYRGRALRYAPDLIVGYAAGYRGSWQTGLGGIPDNILEDNNDPWIGDHCLDPKAVPGSFLSTRPIRLADPTLADLPVTILKEFGVPPLPEMHGRPVF